MIREKPLLHSNNSLLRCGTNEHFEVQFKIDEWD